MKGTFFQINGHKSNVHCQWTYKYLFHSLELNFIWSSKTFISCNWIWIHIIFFLLFSLLEWSLKKVSRFFLSEWSFFNQLCQNGCLDYSHFLLTNNFSWFGFKFPPDQNNYFYPFDLECNFCPKAQAETYVRNVDMYLFSKQIQFWKQKNTNQH